MFNYKPLREGKKGWKQSAEEVSEKVRERTVTQIAEETFCLKSDLAGKRLRIAQNGRAFFSLPSQSASISLSGSGLESCKKRTNTF